MRSALKYSFARKIDRSAAKEYLNRLQKCKESAKMSDSELLAAVPFSVIEDADIWFMANSDRFKRWRDFQKTFRNRFIGSYDEEDI